MVKYKVIHYKKDCISCAACAVACPKFWEMDEEGMAHLKGSKEVGDHDELIVEDEGDVASNKEVAEMCPIEIVHVKKVEEK